MSLQSTDPIADLLTRIRNAAMVGKTEIRVPSSKLKKVVAEELAKAVWGNIPKPNIGREEITKKSLGLPRRRQNIIV